MLQKTLKLKLSSFGNRNFTRSKNFFFQKGVDFMF